MPTATLPPAEVAPNTSRNGHFNWKKSYGETKYRGTLEALPRPDSFDLETAVEMMHTDGYCIVPNVIDREEVAHLRKLMDSWGGPDEQYDMKNWCFNKHLKSEFHQNPDLLRYADLPGVIDVVEAIHGAEVRLSGGSSWITGAGREMGIHVDWLPQYLPQDILEDPRVRIPIVSSTAHLYLNDLVPELGPTTLIPGSHRAGRAPVNETSWNGITPKAALLKAGDVMIFRTEVWHGAWRNTCTTDRRYMMQIFYTSRLERAYPALKYPSLYNPEVIARATPRQKKLMGAQPEKAAY